MSVPDLKARVENYCKIDNEIRELNAKITDLRKVRSDAETDLIEILSTDQFKGYEKLKVSEDDSYIRVLQPQKWSKPWSMPKNLLGTLIKEYFTVTSAPSDEGLFNFICEKVKPMLVSDSYSIERVVKK